MTTTPDVLAGLNSAQQRAVETPGGPLLILAGPGSGKTRVIAHRIAHLVENRGVEPWRILAVTFTNKAARELRARVASLLGEAAGSLMLGTFHSVCARFLRIDGGASGIDRAFAIFDGAFDLGVAAITVHGRTVVQRYDGPSNWDFLREVKQHAGDRTVLGSGDLFDATACLDMLRYCGVDGVTVARGAIGNPWIFQQVRALARGESLPEPPSLFEQRDVIAEHYRLAEALYGPERCLPPMRKFGIKYARMHPQGQAVRGRPSCPRRYNAGADAAMGDGEQDTASETQDAAQQHPEQRSLRSCRGRAGLRLVDGRDWRRTFCVSIRVGARNLV